MVDAGVLSAAAGGTVALLCLLIRASMLPTSALITREAMLLVGGVSAGLGAGAAAMVAWRAALTVKILAGRLRNELVSSVCACTVAVAVSWSLERIWRRLLPTSRQPVAPRWADDVLEVCAVCAVWNYNACVRQTTSAWSR